MIKTRTIVLLLASLAVLAILPLFLTPNLLNAAIKMMIAALFALAFTLAMGQAGMLSFGHAVYYGLGAYFQQRKDLAQAKQSYKKVLAIEPENAQAKEALRAL